MVLDGEPNVAFGIFVQVANRTCGVFYPEGVKLLVAIVAELTIVVTYPECSVSGHVHRHNKVVGQGIAGAEGAETQAVVAHQTFSRSNPHKAVWSLFNGIDEILRQSHIGIEIAEPEGLGRCLVKGQQKQYGQEEAGDAFTHRMGALGLMPMLYLYLGIPPMGIL